MVVEARRLPFAGWLALATIVLLPFGVAAELPVMVGAIAGTIALFRRRFDWQRPALRLALALGCAYWLPEVLSAFDSIVATKSWSEVALDLRFIVFLLYLAGSDWRAADAQRLMSGIALVTGFWCLDALLQAATGYGLGGAMAQDRLSGIFGAGNLKLGGVMALLAPFLLLEAWRWRGPIALLLALLALLVVVLLAGARAAWVGLALGSMLVGWQVFGARRAARALAALVPLLAMLAAVGYVDSSRFAQRMDRTIAALSGDRAGLDHALTGRLQIWEAAWRMGAAHPLNGVGVRGFRYAYPEFANADDAFLANGEQVMHAHQIVLELWSETGALGLGVWLLAVAWAWRGLRRFPAAARRRALPASIALGVALFPFNTHYAMYSAFWGLLVIWLVGVWLALLGSDPDPGTTPSA